MTERPMTYIDEVMLTPGGCVVFVTVTWRDGSFQRSSVAFEQSMASRMACGRMGEARE